MAGRTTAPAKCELRSVIRFSHSEVQHSAVLEESNKKIPAEDESDALYLDGEVTEYGDQEIDSGTSVGDSVHEEYSN
ncbi:hypothetical protein AVEN_96070-1 [Araneus ventricosus]|uniref:Uncharacterized protein n=1 Tax=Araneus ventricosus TaxID=182803 RepID=A0A4Y2B6A0_ARAVE|nr:hypothetical protein AVEN_96070-1 [Araneus ventricosus]